MDSNKLSIHPRLLNIELVLQSHTSKNALFNKRQKVNNQNKTTLSKRQKHNLSMSQTMSSAFKYQTALNLFIIFIKSY